MLEFFYCTRHERLYDVKMPQWIPFLRGEVRLVQTISPRDGDLHFQEDVCDVCVQLWQYCLARPCATRFLSGA